MRAKINAQAKEELRKKLHEIDKTEPTKVTVGLGYKVSMGNYENLSLHFSVTDAARPGEKVQDAIDRVYAVVERNLMAKVEEARG